MWVGLAQLIKIISEFLMKDKGTSESKSEFLVQIFARSNPTWKLMVKYQNHR